MKVAINKCFGGFDISIYALKELAMRNAKCIETYTPKNYYGGDNKKNDWQTSWQRDFVDYKDIGDGFIGHNNGYNIFKDGLLYSFKDRSETEARTDKDLIEVIEKLGDNANGMCANLRIIEIPDDVDFEIDDYDGLESIHEKHRSW